MRIFKIILIGIGIFISCDGLRGSIIRVPADMPTIQLGLQSASEGDTILVAPGTYSGTVLWPNIKKISLLSESGPESTIIDRGSSVIRFPGTETISTATIVQGFKITHGSYHGDGGGGGIHCFFASGHHSNRGDYKRNYSHSGSGRPIHFGQSPR